MPFDLSTSRRGALALVGSGEYLDVMDDTDRFLLQTLGGPQQARVIVIPTASSLEPGMPRRWNDKGLAHFTRLGALVDEALIINREDAFSEVILAKLAGANFFYFSGGNPLHLIETFRDTPAWDIITRAHLAGAALAGCSAGAMAFGGHTINVRRIIEGQAPRWEPALGLLPDIITIPHFDRMAHFMGENVFQQIIAGLDQNLPGSVLIGVDEDTALVRGPDSAGQTEAGWQVMGRQTVSVFNRAGLFKVYQAGDEVDLKR